jgi:hypothetical protein
MRRPLGRYSSLVDSGQGVFSPLPSDISVVNNMYFTVLLFTVIITSISFTKEILLFIYLLPTVIGLMSGRSVT